MVAQRAGNKMSNTGLYFDSESEDEARWRYNESDEESLVDVDSPADGYFERRQHPSTTYVPNPATQPRSEEDKAREAASERTRNQQQEQNHGSSTRERERPPSHHSQPRSPVWAANENTPLLDAGPAGPPPDYAAATADRRRHGREGSYGSPSDSAFSSDHPLVRNGLLNEQGVFAQRSEPQSMQDTSSSPQSDGRAGLGGGGGETEAENGGRREGDEERGFVRRHWDRDWNGRRRWTRHLKVKRLFTWLAVFGIVIVILFISGALEDAQENGKYPSGGNGRNQPETPPSSPSRPGSGDGGRGKENDPTEDSPMPPHKATSSCPYHSFSPAENFTFASPQNFSFLEFIEDPTERALFNGNIGGTLQISAAPPSQQDAIVVWVSVAVSGPWEVRRLRRVWDDEAVQLLFPEVDGEIKHKSSVGGTERWTGADGSCMDISAGMLVKPGVRLDGLEISSANFDINIEHGVFDRMEDKDEYKDPAFQDVGATSITAVRGKVRATYLSSRSTYIETTSRAITGTYALRDLLSVKSTSGSIHIIVDPKSASEDDPGHPADFRATSNSGSIDVKYLTNRADDDGVPERDYHTRVETSSGSITGSYILGSTATFESNSGLVDTNVLPYYADGKSTLHTDSGSAQTRLRVRSPYTTSSMTSPITGRDGILGHLTSTHKSRSGALKLEYPDEWEGVVDGHSTSGSIKVHGEDLEILLDEDFGKGMPGRNTYKHVTARKGYGESRLNFATTSGSVDVLVGRE